MPALCTLFPRLSFTETKIEMRLTTKYTRPIKEPKINNKYNIEIFEKQTRCLGYGEKRLKSKRQIDA